MKRAFVVALALALAAASPALAAEPQATYKVVSEDASAGYRVVDVRLDRRISEAEVSAIAQAIQARAQKSVDRTFVYFYLPGMQVRGSSWATASFTPKLKVRIAGLKLDEEEALTAEARADTRNLVGAWLTSAPAAPGKLTIFREKTKIFSEWRLRNGSRTLEELKETRTGGSRRFDNVTGSTDHYILLPSGDLELREKDRLVAVAERVRLEPDRIAEPQSGIARAAAAAQKPGPGLMPPAPAAAVSAAAAAAATSAMAPTAGAERPSAPAASASAPGSAEVAETGEAAKQADRAKAAVRAKPRTRTAGKAGDGAPGAAPAYMRLTQDLFRKPY